MKNKIFFLFLFFIQSIFAGAQQPDFTLYLNNEIKFERLDIENGLSNNTAFGMMQDRKGFMWFATLDGLIKYDGYTLTHYQNNPNDTNSLCDNIVMSVYEDHTGLIWVGTAGGGGVNSFDPSTGKWKRYNHNPNDSHSMGKGSIEGISEDHNGMLWFGSTDGLNRYDPKKDQFTIFKNNPNYRYSLSSNRVYSVKEDSSGRLWVGTEAGLNLYDPEHERFYLIGGNFKDSSLLKTTLVHHLYVDRQGLLWVSSFTDGVFVIDPNSRTCIARYFHDIKNPNSIGGNTIMAITQDLSGSYWISTEQGIYKFEPESKVFTLYQQESYLPKTETKGHIIITDHAGLVWIGTMGRGIIYFSPKPRKFERYLNDQQSLTYGLGSNRIKSFFRSSDNQVYVATSRNLLKFTETNAKFDVVLQLTSTKGIHKDAVFTTACEEKPGIFWLGTDLSGIIRYDLNTGRSTLLQNNSMDTGTLADNNVHILYRDRAGKLWVGSQGGHLQWYNVNENKFVTYHFIADTEELPPNTGIRFIYEDRQGDLWVGVKAYHLALGGNGLYHINQHTGEIRQYKHQPEISGSLSNNGVTCLYEQDNGIFWIGTHGGGLNRLDLKSGKIKTFTKEDGLISNTVQRLAGDRAGNLWLMSAEGITRFNTTTLKTSQFGFSDGLPGSQLGVEVDDYNSYISMEAPDGSIYFGSNNGLTVFHPDRIQANTFKPPVAISQFKVFDKNYAITDKKISLPYNKNFFDLEFVALSYLSSERNQYAYMLEGVDKDWVNSGTQRTARYTNVSPGTYTFRVKGSNNDGMWNEEGATLIIVINPPWWRTWWAYTLYALLGIGSIWAFIHYRSRNLLRQQRRLQKQVTERTAEVVHQKEELQTSLENLKSTQSQLIQSEKMASLGELTAGIAHEIQNPLNFVTNFSDVNKELLTEMAIEIDKGNIDGIKAIAKDLVDNEEKIIHHGKRADSIVKGMLQHSRTSTGIKEPTNINLMADEYLRLSYHGLRAKNKSFNATLRTDFENSVGSINIIHQDLGRVLLNLYNNAFYAVSDKKSQQPAGYEPTVSVSTKRIGGLVELRIKDNGNGIPQKILNKIFQPFFTTKPTGQGTGLGLSLAYDIVKAHGGQLKVVTKEGEGSEFIIELPDIKAG